MIVEDWRAGLVFIGNGIDFESVEGLSIVVSDSVPIDSQTSV